MSDLGEFGSVFLDDFELSEVSDASGLPCDVLRELDLETALGVRVLGILKLHAPVAFSPSWLEAMAPGLVSKVLTIKYDDVGGVFSWYRFLENIGGDWVERFEFGECNNAVACADRIAVFLLKTRTSKWNWKWVYKCYPRFKRTLEKHGYGEVFDLLPQFAKDLFDDCDDGGGDNLNELTIYELEQRVIADVVPFLFGLGDVEWTPSTLKPKTDSLALIRTIYASKEGYGTRWAQFLSKLPSVLAERFCYKNVVNPLHATYPEELQLYIRPKLRSLQKRLKDILVEKNPKTYNSLWLRKNASAIYKAFKALRALSPELPWSALISGTGDEWCRRFKQKDGKKVEPVDDFPLHKWEDIDVDMMLFEFEDPLGRELRALRYRLVEQLDVIEGDCSFLDESTDLLRRQVMGILDEADVNDLVQQYAEKAAMVFEFLRVSPSRRRSLRWKRRRQEAADGVRERAELRAKKNRESMLKAEEARRARMAREVVRKNEIAEKRMAQAIRVQQREEARLASKAALELEAKVRAKRIERERNARAEERKRKAIERATLRAEQVQKTAEGKASRDAVSSKCEGDVDDRALGRIVNDLESGNIDKKPLSKQRIELSALLESKKAGVSPLSESDIRKMGLTPEMLSRLDAARRRLLNRRRPL